MEPLVFVTLLNFGFAQAHGAQIHSEEAFEEFLELQRTLRGSVKEKFENLEALIVLQGEHIAALNNSNNVLTQEVEALRNQLSQYQASTDETVTNLQGNVNQITGRVSNVETLVQQVDAKANQAVEEARNCVRDVRFVSHESVLVWTGPGYVDTPGYLITGVENWNSDDLLDAAHRRRVEVLRGGNWQGVQWG